MCVSLPECNKLVIPEPRLLTEKRSGISFFGHLFCSFLRLKAETSKDKVPAQSCVPTTVQTRRVRRAEQVQMSPWICWENLQPRFKRVWPEAAALQVQVHEHLRQLQVLLSQRIHADAGRVLLKCPLVFYGKLSVWL